MVQYRVTMTTLLVIRALAKGGEQYGLQIVKASGLPTGTVYPILGRLENLGWVASRWEDIDPRQEERPRRRYYRLTREGKDGARAGLAEARELLALLDSESKLGEGDGHD